MSSTQSADTTERDPGTLWTVVDAVRNSALLTLAVLGLVLITIGALLQTGVWPALLAIWGAGLVLAGVTGYLVIWWKRQ